MTSNYQQSQEQEKISSLILTAGHQGHSWAPSPSQLRPTRGKAIYDTSPNSPYEEVCILIYLLQTTHSRRSTTSHPDLFHRLFHQEKYQAVEMKMKGKISALNARIRAGIKRNTFAEAVVRWVNFRRLSYRMK